MDKKNKLGNQGFMLLETLIVSTIILSTLVFLYIQFSNIKSNYDVSFRYNTIPGLYAANEIGDFLVENNNTDLAAQIENETNGYINITSPSTITGNSDLYNGLITDMNINTIIYVNDDLTSLKTYLSDPNGTTIFTEEFKKYIMNLNTNSNTNKDRVIIKFNDNTFASILLGGTN